MFDDLNTLIKSIFTCVITFQSEHLPLFPVETKFLPGVKRRVQLAQDVESAEHRMKKEFRYLDLFESQVRVSYGDA